MRRQLSDGLRSLAVATLCQFAHLIGSREKVHLVDDDGMHCGIMISLVITRALSQSRTKPLLSDPISRVPVQAACLCCRDAIKGQRASRGPSPAAPNSVPPAATGRAAAAASRRASAAAALAADGGIAKPKTGGGRSACLTAFSSTLCERIVPGFCEGQGHSDLLRLMLCQCCGGLRALHSRAGPRCNNVKWLSGGTIMCHACNAPRTLQGGQAAVQSLLSYLSLVAAPHGISASLLSMLQGIMRQNSCPLCVCAVTYGMSAAWRAVQPK